MTILKLHFLKNIDYVNSKSLRTKLCKNGDKLKNRASQDFTMIFMRRHHVYSKASCAWVPVPKKYISREVHNIVFRSKVIP